eukprot:CAMPEP_0117511992 /NCGR_PEP_ID=MMETSP0784-20121206/28799_1 /TAXON_ID=39447 /ORGANISM="" /LENGTH=317 /DNA_ID=CAMNT_0005307693 /DNA_START=198 /DNA_END=1148 /DNA_ORIENTATION=+
MNKDDEYEDTLDKLRGDDFKGLVKSANDAHAQQLEQMCLGSDGSITKANPLTAYSRSVGGVSRAAAVAPQKPVEVNEDDELQRLRKARLAQMQQEQQWRQSGHGQLRELNNEVDFIGVVKPRERAVVLLSEGGYSDRQAPEVIEALEQLAKKHVEAQFCHLELAKAGLLSCIVNLDEGLPVVFILKHGEVTHSLPPPRLFEFCSSTSPMFPVTSPRCSAVLVASALASTMQTPTQVATRRKKSVGAGGNVKRQTQAGRRDAGRHPSNLAVGASVLFALLVTIGNGALAIPLPSMLLRSYRRARKKRQRQETSDVEPR